MIFAKKTLLSIWIFHKDRQNRYEGNFNVNFDYFIQETHCGKKLYFSLPLMMLFTPLCWRVLFSPDEPEVTPEARSRDVWCDPIPGDVTCQCQTVSVTHQPLHLSWLISTHHFITAHTRELELVSRGDTRQTQYKKSSRNANVRLSVCLSGTNFFKAVNLQGFLGQRAIRALREQSVH